MKWHEVKQASSALLRESVKTTHTQIVTGGFLLVALGYLPFRLGDMVLRSLKGSATVLMLAVFCLGLYQLWSQRHPLSQLEASEEDRFIGHALILSGMVAFPFCLSSVWAQTAVCVLVLAGMACSTWGASFFRKHPLPIFLIAVGLIPNPGIVAHAFWETFVPPLMLERLTAVLGLWGLWAIGQPAVLDDTYIRIGEGSVHVAWGCTGFNMGLSVAIAGMLMGLFFKQNLTKTSILMVAGMALALFMNIPRMVLLAMAQVYWGKSHFDFWHDGWGSQIFSATLFTIYYYVAMAFLKDKPEKSLT